MNFPGLAFAETSAKMKVAQTDDDPAQDAAEPPPMEAFKAFQSLGSHHPDSAQASRGREQTPSLEELLRANDAVINELEIELARIEGIERRLTNSSHLVAGYATGGSTRSKEDKVTIAHQLWQQNTRLVRLHSELRAVAIRLGRVI